MAAAQRPLAAAAFTDASGPSAWKTIPSWALVATQDNTIGTANTRFMAERAAPSRTVEVAASHAVLLSGTPGGRRPHRQGRARQVATRDEAVTDVVEHGRFPAPGGPDSARGQQAVRGARETTHSQDHDNTPPGVQTGHTTAQVNRG